MSAAFGCAKTSLWENRRLPIPEPAQSKIPFRVRVCACRQSYLSAPSTYDLTSVSIYHDKHFVALECVIERASIWGEFSA